MTNIYYCRLCGKKINYYYYTNAIYCSDYCRKLDYDIRKGRESRENAKRLLKKSEGGKGVAHGS